MNKITSKLSYFFITLLLGAIVVSFALTGFQNFNSSGDAVAVVDGTPIPYGEYSRALNNEINRYSEIFGGKSLTSQQIKQFRLKDNVLSRLIQQKIMLNLTNKLELNISNQEVKEEIKNSSFFQTNDKFDLNKYKGLLRANALTPQKYETLEIERLKLVKLSQLFESIIVSKQSVKEMLKFKNSYAKVYAVSFDKESMTKHLPISQKEISAFANDKKNLPILKSVYNSMLAQFNSPEKVRANHILIKTNGNDKKALAKAKKIRLQLTPNNFKKLAKKYTDEESGKKTGGELGAFAKGKMVPEFEKVAFSMKPGTISKPVKTKFGYHLIYVRKKIPAVTKSLEQVKNKVALNHLRKTKRNELSEFNKKLKIELKNLLVQKNYGKLRQLSRKYSFTFVDKTDMSILDLKAGSIQFKEEQLVPLFATKNTKTIIDNDEPTKVSLLKIDNYYQKKLNEGQLQKEYETAQQKFIGELNNSLLNNLQEQAKIVSYPNLL